MANSANLAQIFQQSPLHFQKGRQLNQLRQQQAQFAELERQQAAASIIQTEINNEKNRYLLDEYTSKSRRKTRDVQNKASEIEARKNIFDATMSMEEDALLQVASKVDAFRNNPSRGVYADMREDLISIDPAYASYLPKEYDDNAIDTIDLLAQGVAKSKKIRGQMEVMNMDQRIKSALLEQQGRQNRSLEGVRHANRLELLTEEYKEKTKLQEEQFEGQNELALWQNKQFQDILERTKDMPPEVRNRLLEERAAWDRKLQLVNTLLSGQGSGGGGAGKAALTAKRKLEVSSEVGKQVRNRLVSEYSGHGLPAVDHQDDWAQIPGWGAIEEWMDEQQAAGRDVLAFKNEAPKRFLLIDRDQGFVEVPTNPQTGDILTVKNNAGETMPLTSENIIFNAAKAEMDLDDYVEALQADLAAQGFNWNVKRRD